VSDYGLYGRGSIPDGGRGFFLQPLRPAQTCCGAHPASCTVGTGGSFPGGKARPGRDADRSPPSSAEVKKEQELYLLSPKASVWSVTGPLYLLLFINNYSVHRTTNQGGVLSARHRQSTELLAACTTYSWQLGASRCKDMVKVIDYF
jgi:hypothetical protein